MESRFPPRNPITRGFLRPNGDHDEEKENGDEGKEALPNYMVHQNGSAR